jgi:hypothetical protein
VKARWVFAVLAFAGVAWFLWHNMLSPPVAPGADPDAKVESAVK